MRRGVALLVGALGIAAVAGPAGAPPAAAQARAAGPAVDWGRGLVIVTAVGTADRRAPSPEIARVAALAEAEERAAAALLDAARALPVAGGGTVGDALAGAPAREQAVRAAIGVPVELATDRLPDGSVRIRRGLPVEAVRQALAGPRPVAAGAAIPGGAPVAIVVDARDAGARPSVGVAITDGTATVALPAVWVTTAPKDAARTLGGPVATVKARAVDAAGALVIEPGPALEAAAAAGAHLIVVVRERS